MLRLFSLLGLVRFLHVNVMLPPARSAVFSQTPVPVAVTEMSACLTPGPAATVKL